ncbi:Scr1 family TA system antitoxin-like transcriptional regulator [Streptomyces sp. NPDC087864]|uniref:Scr1 family TA system antitoxin-like transcriptional regulator n=1 Tax=Streptomyces sp. NPDC087864 TaxID=3365814 RepID=UPI00380DA433
MSIEDSLVELRSFQPQLVNGLLQTAEYARAVMLAAGPGECSPEELERKVAARMIRQHVLQRQPAPKAHFIYDEAVLDHASMYERGRCGSASSPNWRSLGRSRGT